MMNAQQIIVFVPLLNKVKFPANVITLLESIIAVATYDILPTKFLDDLIYHLPFDDEAFNLRFELLGYGSKFLVGNMGFALWLIIFYLFLTLVYFITYKCECIRSRLGKYLFWNPLLVLFLESF